MSKWILDCKNADSCTLVPYTPPPATVEHYTLAPPWVWMVVAAVLVLVIVAITVVRFRAHTERGDTERARIENPPPKCPTCGWDFKLEPEGK